MKAFVGPRRRILFSFSKKLFALVFLAAFSVSIATPVSAQAPDFQYNFYDRWFTLFGNPSATPTREQVKTREASGLAYKGVINQNSIDQLSGNLSYVYNIGLLVSLDKRLLFQKDFLYKKNDNGNVIVSPKERLDFVSLSSLDIYNSAKRKAEYVFDMIADSSGAGPRGADAFVIRTTYTTTKDESRTIFTRIPNKDDQGETRVVDATSFIVDYDSQKSEIEQQSVIAQIQFGTGDTAAKPGTVAKSDFWYCGGIQEDIPEIDSGLNRRWGVGSNEDGTSPPLTIAENANNPILERVRPEYLQPGSERVSIFGGLCGGTAYYKIGQTLEYTLPTTAAQAIQEQADNEDLVAGATANSSGSNNLPACKTGTFSFNLLGCIAQVLYGLVFYPISFIAGLLGQIFDFFLAYSLSDESYRHGFIETAWRLVRDIANIFFIIIMLYTGLTAVFKTSSTSYKTVIPTLIVNALIINFSLFATRIVIDISNITARLFYNQITVTIDGSKNEVVPKPISEAIVSAFNPQRIFDNVVAKEITYTVEEKDGGAQTTGGVVDFNSQQKYSQKQNDWTTADKDYAQYFILVTLMASLIMWGVAMMFWKTAFLFVGRVIQLYLSMIFSPFAFLSRGNIPLVSKISALKFDTWEGELTKAATMAPIFIFLLYIINAFLDVGFFEKATLNISQGSVALSFLDSVIKILIPMLIVYGLISKAVGIARDLSTSIGKTVQDTVGGFANKAAGLAGGVALGVATGGTALAARGVAARLAMTGEAKAALEAKRAAGGISGRLAAMRLGVDKTLQTSSFDARNTGVFKTIQDKFGKEGIKFNDPLTSRVGMGTDSTKGGVKAAQKRENEKLKKQIESISAGDIKEDKVKEIWEKKSSILIEKEKERLLADEDKLIALHKQQGKTEAEIEAMKKGGVLADDIAKKNITDQYGDVKNNKQLTRALRQEFAQTIAEGNTLGQQLSPLSMLGGAAGAGALTSLLGGGVLPVAAGIGLDANRAETKRREAAQKYFDDAVKNKKKLPKQEKLEASKTELERELEEMDKYVESIEDTLKKHFETMINEANAGNKEFEKFKGRTVNSFKTKPEDMAEAMRIHKENLQADFESKQMDVNTINDEFKAAKKAGNTAKMATLDAERKKAIVERERIKRQMNNVDSEYRSKKETELSKKESELEKIKEKEENKDKPKDNNK